MSNIKKNSMNLTKQRFWSVKKPPTGQSRWQLNQYKDITQEATGRIKRNYKKYTEATIKLVGNIINPEKPGLFLRFVKE